MQHHDVTLGFPRVFLMNVPLPAHIPFVEIAERFGTPAYVIDLDTIKERLARLKISFPPDETDIFYSIKANPNKEILKTVLDAGFGVDACSAGDLWLAESCGFDPSQITFTGVAMPEDLMARLHCLGVRTNLDSASELYRWCSLSPPRPVGLRVAPEVEAGFSEHCQGGLWGGKMGVALSEVPDLIKYAAQKNVAVQGLHFHIGSGMLSGSPIVMAVERILSFFENFTQLDYLNIGGGLGTSYHDDEDEIPIESLAKELREKIDLCAKSRNRPIRLQMEPGEFVAAPAGYLLARVTVKKAWQREGDRREALMLDASMNHFPGGVLYGSMNRMFLAHAPDASATNRYDVYGNTNQSGDRFGGERFLPEVNENDLLILGSCGAYAASRASTFNEHPLAPEVVYSQGKLKLATRRQTFEELFSRFVSTP